MDNNQLIIILFGILYFAFITFTRRKGNFEEFSVAGRSVGTFLIFASICASYIGPGWTLGLTRDGFVNGMFLSWIAPAGGVGLLVTAFVLAPRIRRKFDSGYSIGDVIGGPQSHDHPSVRVAVGIVSLLFLSSITIALSYAGGELINNVFGFPKFWSIAVITTITVIYSFFGGIRATIQTDAVQFLHFVILIPVLAFLIIWDDHFSWKAYSDFSAAVTTNSFNAETTAAIWGLLFLWLLSVSGLDATGISRFLASRDAGVARKAAIMSGVFMGFWFVLMVFIGSAGAYLYPDLADSDQILLHIAGNHFPGLLYGIFIIAMIGVVMSSQDTLFNTTSVIFSEDVLSGIIPSLSDNRKLIYAKLYMIFLGILAVSVASFLSSVLDAIMTLTAYYIPVMIPVTIFAIMKQNHYWQSAIAAMSSGLIAYLIWDHLGQEMISPLIVGTVMSTLIYMGTDYLMKKTK